MIDAAWTALGMFAQPATVLYLVIGIVFGLLVGLLPGLGGTAAVALLLPMVFALDLPPELGLPLLVGAVASVHHSDVIAGILLGIPGSAGVAIIMLDGHALAKQGKAASALSLSFLCSMAGGLLGAIGLTLTIPIARPLILSFGSPEIFMLSVLGISLAALISTGNMLKGLMAAVLGLFLGFIGVAPAAADYRYTFGSLFLYEGVDLSSVALGVFGVAEVAYLVAARGSITNTISLSGSWMDGVRDFLKYWKLVLRGALVGIWAGILPGVGATAGSLMAYGQTVATAKDKSRFGKGDPRGLVGPESANNSCESGDMIPTLLFGVPGGAPAALLLGALLFYGIEPGPRLMTDHLDTVYSIIWAFALASVIASILCFPLSRPLAKLTTVPLYRVAPVLMIIMMFGAFQSSSQFGDLAIVVVLGVLGYAMKMTAFPRAPFLIGFVLSKPLERYYFLTESLYRTTDWLRRPYVVGMILVLVIPLAVTLVKKARRRRRAAGTAGDEDRSSVVATEGVDEGTGPMGNPWWSLGVCALTVLVVGGGLVLSFGFHREAALAPRLVAVVGLACGVVLLVQSVRALRRRATSPELFPAELRRGAAAFGWFAGYVMLIYFLGFGVATLVFVPAFLWRVGRVRPRGLVIYTAVAVALVVLVSFAPNVGLPDGMLLPAIPGLAR
ncbi:MAG: hypothetical protein GEV10_00190 [Streptosporangiales bacterium]|nr:hypothetical protein [Streptosporangiales bacterium]